MTWRGVPVIWPMRPKGSMRIRPALAPVRLASSANASSAARCGATAAGAGESVAAVMAAYGAKVGLAFQITDDILDVEGGFGDLKSGAGLDSKKQKATYPAVHGLARSKEIAAGLIAEAKDIVAGLGEPALPLVGLADLVVKRI